MRILLLTIFALFCFTACSDADLIESRVDFNDIAPSFCTNTSSIVFFKINNEAFETLSLQLSNENESILYALGERTFLLDATTNTVAFRTYNGTIPASYFCNAIPPSQPIVLQNFVSSFGEALLNTKIVDTVLPTATQTDTLYVYNTTIKLRNIRLEHQDQTLIYENINFGSINRNGL